MIKNIVFDQGGVLVTFEPEQYMRKLGYDEPTTEELCENIFYSQEWRDLDEGAYTHREAIELFAQKLPQYAPQIRRFLADPFFDQCRVIPQCAAYLKELKQRGYNIYLLSNFSVEGYADIRRKFEYFQYVDGDVISGHVLASKPEERIYRILFEKYGLEPCECVFIDDLEENIKTGAGLGMAGIVHTDTGATRAQLEPMLQQT